MSKLENYKKGDIVYVHARDKRWSHDYEGVVISVGRKYVTVRDLKFPEHIGEKFEVDNGFSKDYWHYELYHSKDEFLHIREREDNYKTFLDLAKMNKFNDNEVNTILEMYNKRTGSI